MDSFVLQVGKLIDGLGGPVKRNMAVVVEKGVVKQVATQARLASNGGPVLDYPKATLLPGLIDCHTHTNMPGNGRTGEQVIGDGDDLRLLRSARNAAIALRSGVTTLCDNGAWNGTGFALKQGVTSGEVEGSRVLACGRPVTITGGHLWYMGGEADGVGVQHTVRGLVKEGADFIKVAATGGSTVTSNPYQPAFSVRELSYIAYEGHRHGKRVGAHCRCVMGMSRVLEAGHDIIYHAFFDGPDKQPAFDAKVARCIAQQGVWVNPTLHISRSGIWALEKKEKAGALTREEKAMLEQRRNNHQTRIDHCRRMLDAGVKMIAGSDCGWGHYPFGQFAYELECMTLGGMTPLQAITSATSDAAKALCIDATVGSVAAGKSADLLVVDGDPSSNILDLMKVKAVFKGGVKVSG
ncbi:MAG: amidohydrolase family protein [SAR202 cluster bacterium]|nr:amidohydrolase family protein [SAR202 cluster bacterium]